MQGVPPDTPRRMRAILFLCLVAGPAFSHIKLTAPGSFQITDSLGSPNKSSPCGGAGTASGIITTVEAGSTLTVTWAEPVFHPGHFRISIATNESDFITPVPVLTAGGTNCSSAPVQSPVVYPTLVDGLFPNRTSSPPGGYTTTVTVPMMSCANCKLQLMQFMSSHPPSCFYYQCANLRIVMPGAGVGDAGSSGGGGGATGGGGGGAATGGSGGGATVCGASSCAGCCVLDRCEPGTTQAACGVGGAVCSACGGATVCEGGTCAAAPLARGCTSAPGGALIFALGLLALRRSRRT